MTSIQVHATNVTGAGAVQLFSSLLPELAAQGDIARAYVAPETEAMARSAVAGRETEIIRMDRRVPRAVSRVIECALPAKGLRHEDVLLVLGDIPLNFKGRQVVLVQNQLLLAAGSGIPPLSEWKYAVSRPIFASNASKVDAFIVQSEVMKDGLERTYPTVKGRVHIIPQPPPNWILQTRRRDMRPAVENGLNLLYPAAHYPHKNHGLLANLDFDPQLRAAVKQIFVTIDPALNLAREKDAVRCVGTLDQTEMLRTYDASDALLFLSKRESFGFPLLEAMWLDLPIICPDLPYARWMCGSEAVYFDPESPASLRNAIVDLHSRMVAGKRPDWTEALRKFPSDWATCARAFLDVCKQSPRNTDKMFHPG